MKKVKVITLGMCCLTVLSCQTKQGTGALIGTGGGAVLGAIIGRLQVTQLSEPLLVEP